MLASVSTYGELAVEMPNIKFTLYKKKIFAHLGAYFRHAAWSQRARMIFFAASQIMLGSKEATKKCSPHVGGRNAQNKIDFVLKKRLLPIWGPIFDLQHGHSVPV